MSAPATPAAGIHLPWHRVPVAVKAWAARVGQARAPAGMTDRSETTAAPSPPTAPSSAIVRDLSGGFSPGATTILEWPDRSIFVKAVGAELNPDSPNMHRREIVISRSLPRTSRFPFLLDTYDDGDWVALAFEVVRGRPPSHPWRIDELKRVARALSTMHEELTPSPDASLEPLAEFAGDIFGGWAELAASGPPDGIDPWALANLDRLADLEAGWPVACAGSTLVHGDVRADNVLLSDEQVVFVDWPHGAVGNPAFDVIAWAPSVVLEGGPPPEELLARHGPSWHADPDAVTVLLAAIAGFFVHHSLWPAPPGLPTLRPFQAAQGEVALAWLRRRTGW